MSKWRFWESFIDYWERDQKEHSLEASFAGCTVQLIGEENIKMKKDASVEYYIISVGMHHIVFDVQGNMHVLLRQQYVNSRLRRWRSKEYVYTRWYII